MPDDRKLGKRFRIITNRFEQMVNEDLKARDLPSTPAQGFIMGYLAHNPDKKILQKDIEAHMNLTHPTVTGILSRMEDGGLITCSPDPEDRRCKVIRLTKKGVGIDHAIFRCILDNEQKLESALDPEELDTLDRLLDKILDSILPQERRHHHHRKEENT